MVHYKLMIKLLRIRKNKGITGMHRIMKDI